MSLKIGGLGNETMSLLHVQSKVCMAPFHVWSGVYIAEPNFSFDSFIC